MVGIAFRLVRGAPPGKLTKAENRLNLWPQYKRVYAAIFTACTVAFACSSNSSSAAPTCEEATPRLYGLGCTLVIEGTDLTEPEALSACDRIESDDTAGTCSCGSDLNAVLSCWEAEAACGNCESQLAALTACSANCP
jgi:hypothetical protein